MGKPQIGHFVAANEDFPEFKPPKVVRVGFVGYLTINYLPTHVLPNIILHYIFLHYNIIFQHHLTINHLPRRVTQHPTTTPILCMRWGWAEVEQKGCALSFVTHTPTIIPLFLPRSQNVQATQSLQNSSTTNKNPPLDLTRGELHSDPR